MQNFDESLFEILIIMPYTTSNFIQVFSLKNFTWHGNQLYIGNKFGSEKSLGWWDSKIYAMLSCHVHYHTVAL